MNQEIVVDLSTLDFTGVGLLLSLIAKIIYNVSKNRRAVRGGTDAEEASPAKPSGGLKRRWSHGIGFGNVQQQASAVANINPGAHDS